MPRAPPLLVLLLGLLWPPPAAPTSRGVQQWPRQAFVPVGGSANISCSSLALLGLHLKLTWPHQSQVIYYEDEMTPTVDARLRGPVFFSGSMRNLTITLNNLQLNDSGIYTCEAVTENKMLVGAGTLLCVTGACQEHWLATPLLPVALAVGSFLLGLWLGAMCVLKRSQIKDACGARRQSSRCVVYEDMNYSRRNTLSTPNHYQ